MKVAILFNDGSHLADSRLMMIGRELERLLQGHNAFAHRVYGAAYVPFAEIVDPSGTPSFGKTLSEKPQSGKSPSAKPLSDGAASYKDRLRSAVLDILVSSPLPDMFITVGGDGLAAYVAQVLINEVVAEKRPVMLGIAAGTANVGPIVSLRMEQLQDVRIADFVEVPVDAVEVLDGGGHVAYAFNDVILGDTLLATVDGQTCNISVAKLVEEDRKVVMKPGIRIASDGFMVTCGGREVPYASQCRTEDIRQIVVTPLQFDRLYGRAIFGGLCVAGTDGLSAIGLCDRIVVDSDPSNWDYKGFTGTRHLVFGAGEDVTLTGLGPDAHIVVDGNPYLRRHDAVTFRSIPRVISIFRTKGGTE